MLAIAGSIPVVPARSGGVRGARWKSCWMKLRSLRGHGRGGASAGREHHHARGTGSSRVSRCGGTPVGRRDMIGTHHSDLFFKPNALPICRKRPGWFGCATRVGRRVRVGRVSNRLGASRPSAGFRRSTRSSAGAWGRLRCRARPSQGDPDRLRRRWRTAEHRPSVEPRF